MALILEWLEEMPYIYRLGIAFAVIIGQILLIWLVWFLFKQFNKRLENKDNDKIKPFVIHKFKILSAKQVLGLIEKFLRLLKYIITGLQLFITLPIVFSLFPATRELASTLFHYILDPIKNIAVGTVLYIPNFITIIIIATVTRYVLKALRFFALQIEKGKLKLPHFYTEWAQPTYKILQVLLWAFTIAIIYPYLPGSDSRAFQGVSVFIGIIFSIGSTSAIGNLVAGLVITYMRPFKIGDRVNIKDITGFVVEKNLMVVRLKTHKNEYVTFPNLIILGSSIINYNTSSDEDEEGLIIYAEVTVGYSTPWQTVNDILINAALVTEHIQKKPKPFVLQTKLDDFYACYQINCYTKDVGRIPKTYTMLYENIQNGFRDSGIDMTSAHYEVITENKK
ncbi:MAG: mechanosensitive ion channel family protein [Treponema sp.]|nr:mechanosensitive ion channel family protein [Treponema sp.]